jgi:hypothetical protein
LINPVGIGDVLLADNDNLHITDATAEMTISSVLGDLIQFEIYRNTSGADTMAEDALLLGVAIQFNDNVPVNEW